MNDPSAMPQDSDDPMALAVRAKACLAAGDVAGAEALLTQGCCLYPQSAGYAANLGRLYLHQRRFGEAIAPLQAAVILAPAEPAHRKALITAYQGREFTIFDENARKAIILCLRDEDLMHAFLTSAWISLLRLDPSMQGFLSLMRVSNYQSFKSGMSFAYLENEILVHGLRRLIINDPIIERGLTWTRRWLLEEPGNAREKRLPFLCALGQYAFLTEYAFLTDAEEETRVEILQHKAESLQDFALLGCYRPLAHYPDQEKLAKTAENSGSTAFKDLIRAQVTESRAEKEIEKTIPALGAIHDGVSSAVRRQYEENPYPRWASIGAAAANSAQNNAAQHKKILVAGCGTGKEAAEIARLFPLAHVTAIDLSRASLSYAARKCAALDIRNITFAQADILGLDDITDTFDLIVSSGVLHHMDDPVAGWRALLGRLAPRGIMKIALYSTAARRFIRQARDMVGEHKFPATAEGLRAFRSFIFNLDDGNPLRVRLTGSPDFYTLSTLRDLVFHVQEHTFTLPQIQAISQDLDLLPLRVDMMKPHVMANYRTMFPGDPDSTSLDNWHRFEEQDPDIFSGMYSIWFARAAERAAVNFDWIRNTANPLSQPG